MGCIQTLNKDYIRRNTWDCEYRPEQMFTVDFLSKLKTNWVVRTEYPIPMLNVDGKPYKPCVLDIAVIKPKKIAIRLNGGAHFTSDWKKTKDDFQKEGLIQAGWIVLDFNNWQMPNLFKKHKDSETVKLAQDEIVKHIGSLSGL